MHPPFSFPTCGKENGPCTVQKKRPLGRAPVQWPSARNGGRRIGACSDLDWPSGTLCSSAIPVAAVPWRMAPTSSGWLSHGAASLFATAHAPAKNPAARSAAERAEREDRPNASLHPVDLCTRAAGIRVQACTAPRRARREVIANPQAPSLVNSRTATLHGRAKLRPKAFFLLHRARRVLFLALTKREWGAHPPWKRPPGRSPSPRAVEKRLYTSAGGIFRH